MKKQILTLALFCASFSLFAQNEDHRTVISANVGTNAFVVFKSLITSLDDGNVTNTMTATPTYSLGIDYGVKKWFSVGGHIASNAFEINQSGWTDAAGNFLTGDLKIKGRRTPIQGRMLFHYGNGGRMDMYSGLGLGVSIWSLNASGSLKDEFDNAEENPFRGLKSGVNPTGQLVLFGLRGYVTENLGLGFELATGAPYFASLQVNYRLGGGGK